jgi:hypothetical protein
MRRGKSFCLSVGLVRVTRNAKGFDLSGFGFWREHAARESMKIGVEQRESAPGLTGCESALRAAH